LLELAQLLTPYSPQARGAAEQFAALARIAATQPLSPGQRGGLSLLVNSLEGAQAWPQARHERRVAGERETRSSPEQGIHFAGRIVESSIRRHTEIVLEWCPNANEPDIQHLTPSDQHEAGICAPV
jgi:hypothetical protein